MNLQKTRREKPFLIDPLRLFPGKEISAFHCDDRYAHRWEGEVHPVRERYRSACHHRYDLLGLVQRVGYIEYAGDWSQRWRAQLSRSNDTGSVEVKENVGHKVRSPGIGNLEGMLYMEDMIIK